LGQDALSGVHGCRNPRDPLDVRLRELLEISFTIEGAIRHQIGYAIGGLQLMYMGANRLAKVLSITAVATERFH
jgi:hypothetical protein